MIKSLPIRFAGIALAAFALGACIAPDDDIDDEDDFDPEAEMQDKIAAPPPVIPPGLPSGGSCYHGATTQVVAVNINAPRCDLGQVHGIYDWALADGQFQLVQFLMALNGHAKIQCRQYTDASGNTDWCADVIDRYADGTPLVKGTAFNNNARNYFVAYTGDADGSAERTYWNNMLADPMWTVPPVELSETGFILKNGQFVPQYNNTSRGYRLLKFDPRECATCGLYSGPGIGYVSNPGLVDVSNGWWPPVASSSCNIWTQQFGGAWAHMPAGTCAAEINYRATSR